MAGGLASAAMRPWTLCCAGTRVLVEKAVAKRLVCSDRPPCGPLVRVNGPKTILARRLFKRLLRGQQTLSLMQATRCMSRNAGPMKPKANQSRNLLFLAMRRAMGAHSAIDAPAISLAQGELVCEPGDSMRYVYFPLSCVLSALSSHRVSLIAGACRQQAAIAMRAFAVDTRRRTDDALRWSSIGPQVGLISETPSVTVLPPARTLRVDPAGREPAGDERMLAFATIDGRTGSHSAIRSSR
jgi:hypothetical protein